MERLEWVEVHEFGVPVHDGIDPSDDLVAFLRSEGHAGAVNALAGDSASEVHGVLFVDEDGAPARWLPDGGAVGFGRGERDEFLLRFRARFGASAWIGEPDAPSADGRAGFDERSWGIRSFAWYTESQLLAVPEELARRLGTELIWAPIGRGLLLVPRDPEGAMHSGEWNTGRSVLMWSTGTRRGFAAGGPLRTDFHWWDQHPVVIDPSDGWQVDDDGFTVRQLVERLWELDLSFSDLAEAARIPEQRRQEFRIELRRPASSSETFPRLAELCGIPPEVALVAEGKLDPLELPGSGIATPVSLAESLWAESRISLPGPFGAVQSWTRLWQRVTATRPLWYRVATAGVVLGALTLVVMAIAQGRSVGQVILPLLAAIVWILDYVRTRRRRTDRAQEAVSLDDREGTSARGRQLPRG